MTNPRASRTETWEIEGEFGSHRACRVRDQDGHWVGDFFNEELAEEAVFAVNVVRKIMAAMRAEEVPDD